MAYVSGCESGFNRNSFPFKTDRFNSKLTNHGVKQNQDQVTGKGSEVQNNQSMNNNAGTLGACTKDNLAESASQPAACPP